jgi:tetratricopeptide (TPR) repeat protein
MTLDVNGQSDELAGIVAQYTARPDVALLRVKLRHLVEDTSPDVLEKLAEPYRDDPEVMAPIYERIVEARPNDARAIVVLANAYWLQGRGPQAVGDLANRAITADPSNRGAWHLWALAEADPRRRTHRWQQVTERFPNDHLALAAVADNAASVAGAERDYDMLDLAIATYERLLERSTEPAQRDAVDGALRALRGWRF